MDLFGLFLISFCFESIWVLTIKSIFDFSTDFFVRPLSCKSFKNYMKSTTHTKWNTERWFLVNFFLNMSHDRHRHWFCWITLGTNVTYEKYILLFSDFYMPITFARYGKKKLKIDSIYFARKKSNEIILDVLRSDSPTMHAYFIYVRLVIRS